jgi:hypothetical protein
MGVSAIGPSELVGVAEVVRLGAVLFGFKETLLTNRELVDAVCEMLFKIYNVEPKPATESDEYYEQYYRLCFELVLKNEDASDAFFWLAFLYIMPRLP